MIHQSGSAIVVILSVSEGSRFAGMKQLGDASPQAQHDN